LFTLKKEIDNEAKGLTQEALDKSRVIRDEFKSKFGGIVPQSILVNDRGETKRRKDIITDEMGGGYAGYQKEKAKKLVDRRLRKSAMVTQGRTKYDVLSAFPQNVGRIITDVYCPEGGIVYDPFAGHNSRMELVYKTNRHYIGVDVSKRFMAANSKIKEVLIAESKRVFISGKKRKTIRLITGSSGKVDLPDEFADFTITSPPYWDIEYYGDEPEQLGNAKTYKRFLELLYFHVEENHRILKQGSFCCWFINDFRKKKVFYPYHMDLYSIFCGVGFIPFNVYIVDLGQPLNAAFVQDIIKHKLLPKRHEYCLVFKKGIK